MAGALVAPASLTSHADHLAVAPWPMELPCGSATLRDRPNCTVGLLAAAIGPVAGSRARARSREADIFYASDEGLECKSLRRVRADGTGDALLADLGWDITTLQVAPAGASRWPSVRPASRNAADCVQRLTGDLLAFVINEDGFGALFFMRPSDGAMARVGHLPKGLVHGIEFSPDGMALAITLNTPVTPGDVFSLQLPTDRSVLFAAGIALGKELQRTAGCACSLMSAHR